MKKSLFFIVGMLFAQASMHAQLPFNTRDSITINNINAMQLVHGDMWWDPSALIAKCQYPPNSGKNISFLSSVWMSGYDGSGQLHVAAQTYRQNGNDYWPGPLDNNDTLTYATSQKWAKIWKVFRSDIQYFQSLSVHSLTNTPAAILTWPAAGNLNAAGNGGAPLVIATTASMAPFVDVNSNGIYEPLLGDYPDIKGDEALWWVFSDNGPTHTETNGKPLGVEVHTMCYGYGRGTLIDNVIYYEYTVTNKSLRNYTNFRIALFSDADLGYFNDDFIGFDSVRRMGILYNGTADDGAFASHPANSYGTHVPVTGITLMQMPGDAGAAHVPVGNFDYYNNDNSGIGNPTVDTEFNNYIRGKWRNGNRYTKDFVGHSLPPLPTGTGPVVNYVYPGDPSDTSQWSECAASDMPGDRRFIISSNDFSLAAGETKKLVMALVVTDTNQGGCPGVGFHDVRVVADTAWSVYTNPPPPIPAAVNNINKQNAAIRVYPNPAHDKLIITAQTGKIDVSGILIYNTLGQLMHVPITENGAGIEANLEGLPNGIYFLLCQNMEGQNAIRFLRE